MLCELSMSDALENIDAEAVHRSKITGVEKMASVTLDAE